MEVILYSNGCPQCKVLKSQLDNKGIGYNEVNDIELMLLKGFKSMPMLEVNGDVMTYAQALKWLNNEKQGGLHA